MKNNEFKITSNCLHDTQDIGIFLGNSAKSGFNYFLTGDLGTGKTSLTQGILKGSLPSTVPFLGPETLERRRGRTFRARIGANESAFGISPLAQKAMSEAISRISWYNDPDNFDIRNGIADHLGIPPENVGIGAGIDDLLGLVVRIFIKQGEHIVTTLGAYPTFHYHLAGLDRKSTRLNSSHW